MMVFLYSAGIRFYAILVRLLSLVSQKAKRWSAGQDGVWDALQQLNVRDVIWFHCASVGEFEQGMPLYEKLKTGDQARQFLFTFFSSSGYAYVKARHPDLCIAYLPLDTASNARRFIELVRPKGAFFIKYEFWFHYLSALQRNAIPVYLVSGIFRSSQPFFAWYGGLHRRMLSSFTRLFVQDEGSVTLLKGIGVSQVSCCGDTRFDRVLALSAQPFNDPRILSFVGQAPVFIAGSAWPRDIPVLRQIIRALPPEWKVIIAPHEIGHFPAGELGEEVLSYSGDQPGQGQRILVLDKLGLLSRLYRLARFAYIGGGYGKGIHNVLEASVYAIPVLFGPRHQKFREAIALRSEGLAFDTSEKDLDDKLRQIIHDPEFRRGIQVRCRDFIARNTHVSDKILVELRPAPWMR